MVRPLFRAQARKVALRDIVARATDVEAKMATVHGCLRAVPQAGGGVPSTPAGEADDGKEVPLFVGTEEEMSEFQG